MRALYNSCGQLDRFIRDDFLSGSTEPEAATVIPIASAERQRNAGMGSVISPPDTTISCRRFSKGAA